MIPIDAASLNVNATPSIPVRLNAQAPRKVTKIPSCAAAPSSKLLGFAIRGPKFVASRYLRISAEGISEV